MEAHTRLNAHLETAREILRYFIRHPDAKDTLEGIARWWFGNNRFEKNTSEVAESLHLLMARGFVIERHGQAIRPYYQMNPAKRADIAEFVNGNGR